jgi:hypothetical protein
LEEEEDNEATLGDGCEERAAGEEAAGQEEEDAFGEGEEAVSQEEEAAVGEEEEAVSQEEEAAVGGAEEATQETEEWGGDIPRFSQSNISGRIDHANADDMEREEVVVDINTASGSCKFKCADDKCSGLHLKGDKKM